MGQFFLERKGLTRQQINYGDDAHEFSERRQNFTGPQKLCR